MIFLVIVLVNVKNGALLAVVTHSLLADASVHLESFLRLIAEVRLVQVFLHHASLVEVVLTRAVLVHHASLVEILMSSAVLVHYASLVVLLLPSTLLVHQITSHMLVAEAVDASLMI